MRVNVDSVVFIDPRFDRLASMLETNRPNAVYRCIELWLICYETKKSTHKIDAISARFGADFVSALCACELAHVCADATLIKISGVDDRIEFLLKQSTKSRNGGIASGRKRNKNKSLSAEAPASNKNEAVASRKNKAGASENSKPTSLSLSLSPDLSPEYPEPPKPPWQGGVIPEGLLFPVGRGTNSEPSQPAASKIRPAAKSPDSAEHHEIFAEYHERFLKAYGSKPEMGGRVGKILRDLIARNGAAVMREKLRIAYETPPEWPATTWSLDAIKKHWDLLVAKQPQAKAHHVGYTTLQDDKTYDPIGKVKL